MAETQVPAPASKPAPRYRLLETQAQFGEADFARRLLLARPVHGVPAEAVLDPAFWANCARKLRVGDRLEVVAQDGTYDLDLRVLEVGPTLERPLWARMVVLRANPKSGLRPEDESPSMDDGGGEEKIVEFAGSKDKWRVLRKSDKAVLAAGFDSKEAAERASRQRAPAA